MDLAAFNELTLTLSDVIKNAVTAHLAEHNIKFDPEAYFAQASTDHDQLAKEILFHGAGIFPEIGNQDILLAA